MMKQAQRVQLWYIGVKLYNKLSQDIRNKSSEPIIKA